MKITAGTYRRAADRLAQLTNTDPDLPPSQQFEASFWRTQLLGAAEAAEYLTPKLQAEVDAWQDRAEDAEELASDSQGIADAAHEYIHALDTGSTWAEKLLDDLKRECAR